MTPQILASLEATREPAADASSSVTGSLEQGSAARRVFDPERGVNVSRRALVTALGGGLLAAGCNGHEQSKENSLTRADVDAWVRGKMWGGDAPHGMDVGVAEPCPLAAGVTFSPRFLCVQYLRFEGNQLTCMRGYVPYTNVVSADIVSATEAVIRDLKANSSGSFVPDHNGTKIHKNMDFIGFGSQQVFAIFLDNPENYVEFEKDVPEFRVKFTSLSGRGQGATQVLMRKNNAFVNLNERKIAGYDGERVLYLEYWNTDENGKIISPSAGNPATHYRYSMNIQLKMSVGGGKSVPLILDPDTGNMGGTP